MDFWSYVNSFCMHKYYNAKKLSYATYKVNQKAKVKQVQ
jgi:hypothetical protein